MKKNLLVGRGASAGSSAMMEGSGNPQDQGKIKHTHGRSLLSPRCFFPRGSVVPPQHKIASVEGEEARSERVRAVLGRASQELPGSATVPNLWGLVLGGTAYIQASKFGAVC